MRCGKRMVNLRLVSFAALGILASIIFIFAVLCGAVWHGSRSMEINSAALGEHRSYTLFGNGGGNRVIYSLDGGGLRNGLFPATIFAASAWLRGRPAPIFVAIHSNANRDIDFRNQRNKPAYWRPAISGRSDAFDRFLTLEIMPKIEKAMKKPAKRYGLGHSLAGLYILDLTGRKPALFEQIYVFSPTFSHDMSISNRLAAACRNTRQIYANIGLESGRDSAMFGRATRSWQTYRPCDNRALHIRWHFGVPHQLIMVTGQLEAAFFHFP